MKLNFILLIVLIYSCNSKSANSLESSKIVSQKTTSIDFERNYIGTINNKLNVVFQLKNKNGKISGSYFYEKKGVDMELVGELLNDKLVVYELDFQNNKVAKISANLIDSHLNGEWKNLKTNQSFKIVLKEINKKINPLPKNIEGVYKEESQEEENCHLVVKITRHNGEYFYNFKSDKRDLNGKVSFGRYIDENEIYITLEGIRWAENEGDISNDSDDKKHKALELPVGVEGLFSENEIDIQNYGNAMNSYLKLTDCGAKYISLKK